MDAWWAFIMANRLLLGGIFFLLITGFLIWKNRYDLYFWWFNHIYYGFPIIGKLSKLAKNYESKDENNCRLSEKQLCQDYMVHYDRFANKNVNYYDNCKSYLGKVDERNRNPLPWYVAILTVMLVFVEAMGFSYVLAGWTIPGASETTQQYGAVGIAFLVSVILVLFTHWAGHEIYQNSLITKVRKWWLKDLSKTRPASLVPNLSVSLEHNHLDDDQPVYMQLLNRINTNDSVTRNWTITVVTAIIIVVVAIGATYVRGQVLEKQMIEEVTSQGESFYGDIPSAVTDTQSKADRQALSEKQDAERKGGWGTFIVLAFIFIFLQFLGILFGYKWGFAGKESKLAWKDSHDFTTRESFVAFFQQKSNNIAKIAQGRLTDLHKKLQEAAMSEGIDSRDLNTNTKTFLDYVADAKRGQAYNEATITNLSVQASKLEVKPVENSESLKCPSCGNEVQKGAKFCPHCATKIESLIIVDPTCPTCGRHYPQGTKFCPEHGTALVSADKLKYECVKCGKVYPEGTKFCSEDGGEVKVGLIGE